MLNNLEKAFFQTLQPKRPLKLSMYFNKRFILFRYKTNRQYVLKYCLTDINIVYRKKRRVYTLRFFSLDNIDYKKKQK